MRRAERRAAGLCLAAAAMLHAACSGYVEQRVQGALLEALPRVIGPADRYEATVRGANADASHFDQVHAVGMRVRRPGTPVFDRIEADLQDVQVDRQARRVSAIGAARASIRLTADDLAAYLREQPWIEAPAVRFEAPSDVVVSGRLKVPGMPLISTANAEFRGRLVPRESRLLLQIEALRYGERDAPPLLRLVVEQAINPVFDAAGYAVPSRFDSVMVDGDALVVDASGSRVTLQR